MNLRWCVYHISKKRKYLKQPTWNNFNVAMSQTSQEIKYQNITIYQASWSISHHRCPKNRYSNHYRQKYMFQKCCVSSCIYKFVLILIKRVYIYYIIININTWLIYSYRLNKLVLEMNDEVNDSGWKDNLHGTSYVPNNKVVLRLPRGGSKLQ